MTINLREKSRIMPGVVRLLVQLQHPAQTGVSLNMAVQLPGVLQDHFTVSAYDSRKDGAVSGEGQLHKLRDGFRIERLVMSINV